MSRHLSLRLTTVHRAVSMALFCSLSYAALVSNAQAATIGKTLVTSAQHEPLAASIDISDINAADFSARLADAGAYQQMGLSQTGSMSVRFQPTSATSGRVLITTSQPVSKPFADVVLAINDNGQRNIIPKTLLMPLNSDASIQATKNTATGAQKPNLPRVSQSTAKPLTVRKGMPPPLISAPVASAAGTAAMQTSVTPADNHSVETPSPLKNSRLSNSGLNNSRLDNGRLGTEASNRRIAAAGTNNSVIAQNEDVVADTNKQLDILNIQVTRKIQSNRDTNTGSIIAATPKPSDNIANNNIASDSTIDTTTAKPADNVVTSPKPKITKSAARPDSIADSAGTQYQVQRNDSLWIIAQQIAKENNLDIQAVMKQIQSQNPNAFINKDADQLKADAKLNLPSYDVIPSQKKLEAAISAQRQYSRKANSPVIKKKAAKAPTTSAQTTKRPKKPKITKTQTLPKAQFSVLAPGRNGSADGTQAKSATLTGNGLSTDILATLKAARKNTASQAQQLSKTSNALDSYTKKIQLQNQKLAELQARLKKLRNQ